MPEISSHGSVENGKILLLLLILQPNFVDIIRILRVTRTPSAKTKLTHISYFVRRLSELFGRDRRPSLYKNELIHASFVNRYLHYAIYSKF